MEPSPSLDEWRDLYSSAVRFKEIRSWDWMLDSDVFGVQNPFGGEIGYCCVMGRLGQVFALVVYLGTEGLEVHSRIQSGERFKNEIDALTSQKCLMASFEDREVLQKRDLQVMRELGLKFRGRNAWPLFRSYQPGYYPWYLTDVEAKYLTLALQQATEVALRFEKDEDMLTPPEEGYYLVRVPERKGNDWEWRDEWLRPLPMEKRRVGVKPINEVLLEKVKKISGRRGTWEVGFFYSPVPVKEEEDERPYYPLVFLCVDHHSGFILGTHISGPREYAAEFPEQFLSSIEKIGFLPEEVQVEREGAWELLEPVTSKLNVKLKLVKRLQMLKGARNHLFNSLLRDCDPYRRGRRNRFEICPSWTGYLEL
ncbi:MAG: DUF7309 domain-containing protein [bacterium]